MKVLCILYSALASLVLRAQEPPLISPPAMAEPADPGPSRIALPIRVNLDTLFKDAERAVPVTPPGVNAWAVLPDSLDGSTLYRFNLYRDPLVGHLAGNRITVRTKVHYWMEVGLRMAGNWVKGVGSCGRGQEGFREAWLGAEAEVGFTPAWGLTLQVRPEDPVLLNRCEITFLKVDITPSVQSGMKDALVKAAGDMEMQVRASALLRDRATALWNQMQQPIELAHGMYLMANPELIRMAPMHSEGRTLIFTPEIQTRPSVVFGVSPAVEPRSLPPLDLASQGAPGFHVRLALDLPFDSASEQLSQNVVGKVFDTDKGRFEIRSARVWGQAGQAYLEVEMKGRVDGRLTLAGRPLFDEATGQLVLRDLDYTLESQGWFTRLGVRLFRGSLRKTLAEKANFFLNQSLAEVRNQVQLGLNRDLASGMRLSGSLDGFRLSQPRILEDRFQVEALLDGQVQVDLDSVSSGAFMNQPSSAGRR